MNKRMMNGCIALAILLLSLASLSAATCPWFLKGELYSATCGVDKVVLADKGILANDPQGVVVLNPESITIDPKYGTIDVAADGSFVYKPSKNIQQGTYVQFRYNATNGQCTAKYPATAKFQIVCTCKAHVGPIPPICLPVTLDEIKDILEEAEIGCVGCGDVTTPIDLGIIDLDENGMPVAGTYEFCIKCPGCQLACGEIVLIDHCDAQVENYTFCEGSYTLEQFKEMATRDARCIDCDLTPVMDFSGVEVVDGFVDGGSFTGTCGDVNNCGGSDTGYITIVRKCDCEAISFTIDTCMTPEDVEAMIKDVNSEPCGGDCDDTPEWHFSEWQVNQTTGYVESGVYAFSVTCHAGDETVKDCDSTCSGEVRVTCQVGGPCEAYAPDICLPIVCTPCCLLDPSYPNRVDICCLDYYNQYNGYTDFYDKFAAADGGCSGCCDNETIVIPPGIDWTVPGQYEYTVKCEGIDCSDEATGIISVIEGYCH